MTTTLHAIKLPAQDWERILRLGADHHARELDAELTRAEQSIARFERRFGMPLSRLERIGLPADADFETHEAYIEWCSWDSRLKELRRRLATLRDLSPADAS